MYVMLFAILTLLCGCGKQTTVVLLPDPEGTVGQVTVSTKGGSVDLSRAGEAVVIASATKAPSTPKPMKNEEIEARFSKVLAALPAQPEHFMLYFKREATELTAESQQLVDNILIAIKNKNSEHIRVIGHTDTTGNRQFNLRLSQKRADTVRDLLISKGVDNDHMSTTSHGEEDPLVKTADNVAEPRNRRVEVVVR